MKLLINRFPLKPKQVMTRLKTTAFILEPSVTLGIVIVRPVF